MPLPKGLPWGDSSRGLHQTWKPQVVQRVKDSKAQHISTALHGLCNTSSKHTNLPSSWPYAAVSWYLPGEVQVMFSKEMKQQNKTQCHPLKQQLQSRTQRRRARPQKSMCLKGILLYSESKIVQWPMFMLLPFKPKETMRDDSICSAPRKPYPPCFPQSFFEPHNGL